MLTVAAGSASIGAGGEGTMLLFLFSMKRKSLTVFYNVFPARRIKNSKFLYV